MSLYKATGDTAETAIPRLYDKLAALKEENARLHEENERLRKMFEAARTFEAERIAHRAELGW